MAAKKGFSERAWDEIINGDATGHWIDGTIEAARQRPDDPFADSGPLLEAMLKKGVTREQICRLARHIRYETVFETVQLAAEEGLDGDQLEGVHEELLASDPSGKDGRPGSWPVAPVKAPAAKKSKAKPATKSPSQSPSRAAKSRDPYAPLLTLPKADDFAFSPDGRRLWLAHTSVNSSTVRGIELPGGGQFVEFNALPNLRGLACSPDGKRLAVSNHYGIVASYDGSGGRQLWASPRTGDETFHLAYAPDGSMVLNGAIEQTIRRRDARTGKELPPLDVGEGSRAGGMAFSPDGKTLAVIVHADEGTYMTYWDWRAARELARKPCDDGEIEFLPDGRTLLTIGYGQVTRWDVASVRRVKKFKVERVSGGSAHPGGRLLALNTSAGVEVRELPSGKLIKKLDTEELYPDAFAFSPDGAHVLLVASPKSFVWSVEALLAKG